MTGARSIELRAHATAPCDALQAFAASRASRRFYWERPARDEAVFGEGAARVVEAAGQGAVAALAARSAELWKRTRVSGSSGGLAPLLVGGLAFDPAATASARWAAFAPARLVLPERLRVQRSGRAAVFQPTERAPLGPKNDAPVPERPAFRIEAEQDLGAWRGRVATARRAVRSGVLEKVVLARSCLVTASSPIDAVGLLAALRERHPGCTLFAVAEGDAVFLGATPEELVEVSRDGGVRASALAGSAPRGRSPEEDRAFARALVESKKEQEEHAVVVRAVREALAGPCAELRVPEAPGLLRTDGIQHLHTPFEGRLADPGAGVLDLVARLHPTPAVGGAPRARALEWLREHEELERGWYAGCVGCAGPAGEGAFAVALRSALVSERQAVLFAGAGIVADSDPEAELAETRLKLRSVLGPLVEV